MKFPNTNLTEHISGLVSHLLSTASTFLLTLVFVNVLPPREFGEFSILQATALLLAGLLGALITTPAIINLPLHDPRTVLASLNSFVIRYIISVAVLCVLTVAVGAQQNPFVLCMAVVFAQYSRDLVQRVSLVGGVSKSFLFANSTSFAIVLTISALLLDQEGLSLAGALGCYLLALVAPVLIASISLRPQRFDSNRLAPILTLAQQNMPQGISTAATFVLVWVQSQSVLIFAFSFINAESSSLVAASRIIVAPLVFVAPMIATKFMRTVRMCAPRARRKLVFRAFMTLAVVLLVYVAASSMAYHWYSGFIYRGSTAPPRDLVVLIVVLSSAQLMRDLARSVMYAMSETGRVFRDAGSSTAVLVLLAFAFFMVSQSVYAFALAAIVAEVLFLALVARGISRSLANAKN